MVRIWSEYSLSIDHCQNYPELYTNGTIPQQNQLVTFRTSQFVPHQSCAFIKLGCVVKIVVDFILPHEECGLNDCRKNPFSGWSQKSVFIRANN